MTRVRAGSTAEDAGVEAGDTLASINGTKPASIEEAKRLLYGMIGPAVAITLHPAGRDLHLKIARDGKATGLTSA